MVKQYFFSSFMDFPFQHLFIRSNKLDKTLTDLVVWVRLISQRSDFLDPVVAAIHTSGVATRVTKPSSLEAATLVRLTFPYTTTPQHSLPSNCQLVHFTILILERLEDVCTREIYGKRDHGDGRAEDNRR